ncbi:MAG: AAA family ATPase, partial [Acidimicrobiales bacterium]
LEQTAERGQTVVAERTARQARGFRFQDLGPLALKGKSIPVRAYLLDPAGAGVRPVAAERGLAGLRAPMVGRDAELALVRAIVDRCETERHPHLVTVYGDAGVGKSRLVRELVEWAEQRPEPPLILRGRCLPYGDGVTYWPLSEMLKELAGILDSDDASTVMGKLRAMGNALPGVGSGAETDRMIDGLAATIGVIDSSDELSPRQLRTEMHAAWRTLLTNLASAGTVFAIVEDIHWGDSALLDLLEELAERCAGALVLICPSRPDLTAHRPGWGGGRRNASAIALDPLSMTDAARLTSLLLDIDDLPDVVRARILERAEGNPFFLEEILRQLIDEKSIVRDDQRWRAAADIADVRIPDSVQSVLAARIDLLPLPTKRMLQRASVVGRVFWTGSLGEPVTDSLDELLDVLEGRDLITTRMGSAFRGERECIFRHVLTCDVAYESIPRRQRAGLHAEVAAWLEDVARGREGEFAELLAHHWSQAFKGATSETPAADAEIERRRGLAYRWSLTAAHDARRRGIAERARSFAQHALELAVSPDEVADAAVALGEAHQLMGDGSPAVAAFRVAADALIDAGAPDPLRAASLCGRLTETQVRFVGSLREPVDQATVWSYVERGLTLAGEGDSEARARLLLVRSFWGWGVRSEASTSRITRSSEERAADAAEAVGIAARLGLAEVESAALDGVGSVAIGERRYHRVSETIDRRLVLLPRLRDPFELGDALVMAAQNRFEMGGYAEASTLTSRVYEEVDTKDWASVLFAMAWRAKARLILGEWDEVLDDLATAAAILRAGELAEPPPFSSLVWTLAAFIYAARGQVDDAHRLLAMFPTRVEEGALARTSSELVLALVRRGRLEEARRSFKTLEDQLLAADVVRALARIDLAEADGDWAGARRAIDSMLETPEPEGPPKPYAACAAELQGREALFAGDHTAAQAELERALALWSGLGAVWPAARVQLALARALHDKDPDAASECAHRALGVFERLGSIDEIEQCRSLIRG